MNDTATMYVEANDVERLLKEDNAVILIDARTAEEFSVAHVPGAINVPIAELADFVQKHLNATDEILVTMCGSTGRGEKASLILRAHGMANVQVMKGGLKAWQTAGFPVA